VLDKERKPYYGRDRAGRTSEEDKENYEYDRSCDQKARQDTNNMSRKP